MALWHLETLDVYVDYADVLHAHEEALQKGKRIDNLLVPALVDIDDALEEASVDQLREALGRELPGYTLEQLDAIRACFTALAVGDHSTASALLNRVFEHTAQITAAEDGMKALQHRWAA